MTPDEARRLIERLERMRWEVLRQEARANAATAIVANVLACCGPDDVQGPDGKRYRYNDPDPATTLRAIQSTIRAAIDAARHGNEPATRQEAVTEPRCTSASPSFCNRPDCPAHAYLHAPDWKPGQRAAAPATEPRPSEARCCCSGCDELFPASWRVGAPCPKCGARDVYAAPPDAPAEGRDDYPYEAGRDDYGSL